MPKKKYNVQRIIISLMVLIFTAILIINNSTQLLQTYNVQLSQTTITYISFIGLILSSIWAVILASMGRLI